MNLERIPIETFPDVKPGAVPADGAFEP